MIYLNSNYSLTPLLPIIGLYVVTAFRLVPSVMKILNMLQQIKGLSPSVDFLNNEFETLDLDKGGQVAYDLFRLYEFLRLNLIKDLYKGKEASKGISDNEEWRTGKSSQITVPLSKMTDSIIEIIKKSS